MAPPPQKMDAAVLAALLDATQADPAARSLRFCDAGITPNLAVPIADFLETNRSLTALDLSGNAIGAHGAACIAASLLKNGGALQRLVLARCGLKSDAVAAFAASFEQQKHPALQCLDLSDNQIDDDAADALASLVTATCHSPEGDNDTNDEHDAVLELDLRRNELADGAVRALAKALQTNSVLVAIRLEGNEDEDAAIAKSQIAFCLQRNRRFRERRALYRQLRGLRDATLVLQECKLFHVALTLDEAQLLSDALRENRSVLSLELRDNALPAEGTRRILHALERHPSLRRLRIHDNPVGDDGFLALAQLLCASKTLTSVAVIHSTLLTPPVAANPPSRVVLAALHHTLARDTLALRALTLAGCGFGDLEIGVVASGIAWACCLESLDFHDNQLSDRSAHVVARVLQRCQRLHTLDMSGNRLTLEGGALTLARAVGPHEAMRSLSLGRFPNFSREEVDAIVGCLETSATLVRVVLATKERASRCADRVDALMEMWAARRDAYVRKRREDEAQQHAEDARRATHRTLVRRVAVRAVEQLLRPYEAIRASASMSRSAIEPCN